ncbi:YL-like protein [Mya arenaria]|uniref:YL-like protein n=1 Tax=Mya arenaria TaxID=6604 RepID=A0ABY7GA73_MYAAR|nr:YL-like protein [Mya arenaria]
MNRGVISGIDESEEVSVVVEDRNGDSTTTTTVKVDNPTDCNKVFLIIVTGSGPFNYVIATGNTGDAFTTALDTNSGDEILQCNMATIRTNAIVSYSLSITITDTSDSTATTQTVTVTVENLVIPTSSCSCSAGNYLCDDDKTCIPKGKLCDGEQQCPDGDDEKNCFSRCAFGQIICPGTGNCANVCNNITECDRKEDEQNCAFEKEPGPSAEETEQRLRDLIRQICNEPLRIDDLERDGWMMVFRATSANGNQVYPAYANGYQTTTIKPIDMDRSYDSHYRLRQLETVWNNGLVVNKVKVGLYKNNREVGYIIFNGVGSNYTNWFQSSRIMESTWSDLTPAAMYNVFSIKGDLKNGKLNRRFFINEVYDGCNGDIGHLVIIDESKMNKCRMDKHAKTPMILYSESNSNTFWKNGLYGTADYFAVFVM